MAFPSDDAGFQGFVEHIGDGVVWGWCLDASHPNDPVIVHCYVDGERVAVEPAEKFRKDLTALGSHGKHAFSIRNHKISPARDIKIVAAQGNWQLPPLAHPVQQSGPGERLPSLLDPYRYPPHGGSFNSRFGGLWTDMASAPAIARARLERGELSEQDYRDIMFWIANGYVIIPHAVPEKLVDAFNFDIDDIFERPRDGVWISASVDGRNVQRHVQKGDDAKTDISLRVIDTYTQLRSARDVMFAPAIFRFLSLVFQRGSLAHQSLYFHRGSQQGFHQDTAFVRVSSPMELCASWVALEDIKENSGELMYLPGSHRFPEFLFGGDSKWLHPGCGDLPQFFDHLNACAKRFGVEAQLFRPKKGDALIWSADLVHGGSFHDGKHTRRSLVTHYCPVDIDPMYMYYGGHTGKVKCGEGQYYSALEKVAF